MVAIDSFMSWIGGKKSSRDIIIPRFPSFYERYIEVFGGGGWILFGKPPRNDKEIFNDANSNISNLFYCVREHSAELIEKLRYVLNCREDFDRIKHILILSISLYTFLQRNFVNLHGPCTNIHGA